MWLIIANNLIMHYTFINSNQNDFKLTGALERKDECEMDACGKWGRNSQFEHSFRSKAGDSNRFQRHH